MDKLKNNIYFNLNLISNRISNLEERLVRLDEKMDENFKLLRSSLMRLKNKENLSDEFIMSGRSYYDLTPDRAFTNYNTQDRDFFLLDVSQKSYKPYKDLPEAHKIPLEELTIRHTEILNKNVSLYVISEDGTRSILACETLKKLGYTNLNNISGGYKFWPGFRLKLQNIS